MTNKEIVASYREQLQADDPTKDIDTYQGWKARGFQVQRGSKAVAALEGRGTAKDYSKSKRGRRYYFGKKIYLFGSWQVKDANGESWKPEAGPEVGDDILQAFI